MSHQIWHAFYFDSEVSGMPSRSEVIEASSEQDAARQARDRLGRCVRVSLEAASWTERRHLMIEAAPKESRYVKTLH
jgi:hypothetical protein